MLQYSVIVYYSPGKTLSRWLRYESQRAICEINYRNCTIPIRVLLSETVYQYLRGAAEECSLMYFNRYCRQRRDAISRGCDLYQMWTYDFTE